MTTGPGRSAQTLPQQPAGAPRGVQQPDARPPVQPGTARDGSQPSETQSLLHRIMERLEENDRRYAAALDDLNARIESVAARVESAGGRPGADAALDRVRSQAEQLAGQVREANQALKTAPGEGLRAMAESSGKATVPSGYDRDFASIGRSFERTLAAPAAGLEVLNARIDELAARFERALAAHSGSDALRSIEEQLKTLSGQFAETRDHRRRVEAIETHLAGLVEWTRKAGAAAPPPARSEPIRHQPDTPSAGVGAAIPDCQPASSGRTGQPASMDDDFLASARRAAQAASAIPAAPPPLAKSSSSRTSPATAATAAPRRLKALFGRFRRRGTGSAAVAADDQSKRTRPVLVIAALLLLFISAVLLYGRYKTKIASIGAATQEQSVIPSKTPPAEPSANRRAVEPGDTPIPAGRAAGRSSCR